MPRSLRSLPLALLAAALLTTPGYTQAGQRQELRDRHADLSADLADLEEELLDQLADAGDLLDTASLAIRDNRFRAAGTTLDQAEELIDDLDLLSMGTIVSRREYTTTNVMSGEPRDVHIDVDDGYWQIDGRMYDGDYFTVEGTESQVSEQLRYLGLELVQTAGRYSVRARKVGEVKPVIVDPIYADTSWTWAETAMRFDKLAASPVGSPAFTLSEAQRSQLNQAIEELTTEAARLYYLGRNDAAMAVLRRIDQRQALLDGVSPYSPYFAYISGGSQTSFRLADFTTSGLTRTAQTRESEIDMLESILDKLTNGN